MLAANRDDPRLWALHRRALERGVSPVVPAGVLAQAWRAGRRQVNLARLLAGCTADDLTWAVARETGSLLDRAGAADVIDAHVVVGSRARGDAVVTGDLDDLTALARAAGRRLNLIPV